MPKPLADPMDIMFEMYEQMLEMRPSIKPPIAARWDRLLREAKAALEEAGIDTEV